MTNNQIQYWKLQHDKSVLAETQRHNVATEKLGVDTLKETSRHNVAGELHNVGVLSENSRHNLATERVDIGKLAETKRHNVVDESIKEATNLINKFVATTTNSNKRTELYEQQRSNRAREKETERHNRSLELLDELKTVVQQNYNNAIIEDRAQGRELEAQKLEDQWAEWTRRFDFEREKYATELDKWQREQLVDAIKWGAGELSDIVQIILRGSKGK